MGRAFILISLLVASILAQAPCNSADRCNGNGMCVGSGDTSACMCFEGFSGAHCADKIGKIALQSVVSSCDSAVACSGHGLCSVASDAVSCLCAPGYYGARCERPMMRNAAVRRAVASAPCDARTACNGNGVCLGTAGDAVCMCRPGFVGARCERQMRNALARKSIESAPCDARIACNGNGVCSGSVNDASCTCNPGFGGARCQISLLPHLEN